MELSDLEAEFLRAYKRDLASNYKAERLAGRYDDARYYEGAFTAVANIIEWTQQGILGRIGRGDATN